MRDKLSWLVVAALLVIGVGFVMIDLRIGRVEEKQIEFIDAVLINRDLRRLQDMMRREDRSPSYAEPKEPSDSEKL